MYHSNWITCIYYGYACGVVHPGHNHPTFITAFFCDRKMCTLRFAPATMHTIAINFHSCVRTRYRRLRCFMVCSYDIVQIQPQAAAAHTQAPVCVYVHECPKPHYSTSTPPTNDPRQQATNNEKILTANAILMSLVQRGACV